MTRESAAKRRSAPELAEEGAPEDRPSHDGLTPSRLSGLIAALTLSPATYSRNRFFELYRDPEVRRVRRRAGQLRGLVRSLASSAKREEKGRVVAFSERPDGGVELTYEVEAVGLTRRVWLDPLEIALVRYGISRAGEAPAGLALGPHDGARIEDALRTLVPA